MDVEAYIAGGDLEAYCLGNLTGVEEARLWEICSLFPQVRQELCAIEIAFEKIALATAIEPAIRHKKRLLERLGFAAETLELSHLPVIGADTNFEIWLEALAHLIPGNPDENMVFQPLTARPELSQTLVYTRLGVPEETHNDLIESFFILEGSCTCIVGGQAHHLSPGDFLEIPLHADHDIVLTSPYVLAILQHQPLH